MKSNWLKICILITTLCCSLSIPSLHTYASEEKSKVEKSQNNKQENQKGKTKGGSPAATPAQIFLILGALFGIGSISAVILTILYQIYLSKQVVSLPVIYYEKRGDY